METVQHVFFFLISMLNTYLGWYLWREVEITLQQLDEAVMMQLATAAAQQPLHAMCRGSLPQQFNVSRAFLTLPMATKVVLSPSTPATFIP